MSDLRPKEIFIVFCVVALIVLFFYGMGTALVPLVFSCFLAYASLPIVKKLEARRLTRSQSTLIVLAGVTLTLALFLLIAIPPIVSELRDAIAAAPHTLGGALAKIDSALSEFGIQVPYNRESLTAFIAEYSEKISSDLVSSAAELIKNSISNFASVIVFLLGFALVPVLFYYVITDYEKLTQTIYETVPKGWQPQVVELLNRTDTILSGYVRGQSLVCLILSVLYTACLFIVGVKFALVIGIATGILSVIPYVGFSLGFGLAILSVIAGHEGWGTLLALIVGYSVVQFLESFIITPKIVGDSVGLSPFEAILALVIFGNLFGFIGLLLAIPMGAIVRILIRMLLVSYKRTEFYRS